MTKTDYMCQEKKEEEDCEVVSIERLEEYIKKCKERLITGTSYNNGDIRTNRKTTKNKKWEKTTSWTNIHDVDEWQQTRAIIQEKI